MSRLDPYVKSIMGLSGAILTALAAFYGGTHWYPIAVAVVTAVNVYLAKNTPKGAVWVKPGPPPANNLLVKQDRTYR